MAKARAKKVVAAAFDCVSPDALPQKRSIEVDFRGKVLSTDDKIVMAGMGSGEGPLVFQALAYEGDRKYLHGYMLFSFEC